MDALELRGHTDWGWAGGIRPGRRTVVTGQSVWTKIRPMHRKVTFHSIFAVVGCPTTSDLRRNDRIRWPLLLDHMQGSGFDIDVQGNSMDRIWCFKMDIDPEKFAVEGDQVVADERTFTFHTLEDNGLPIS